MGTWPRRILALSVPLLAVFGAHVASAQDAAASAEAMAASGLNSGDVAWILTSSAIVLMMTVPGLSLFYGGLVRGKNVLSILMLCFITAALVSVIWVLWGYSIAFGPDHGGLFGDLTYFALHQVSHKAGPDENIPAQAFMVFQLMFAIITPALIVGAIAERMKFSAFFLFVLLWSSFIYSPLAHWVWGEGGWLAARGALDFAGGTVVHISSGSSALVAAAMLGRRRGFGREPMAPHNVPFVVVGAALLWVGWFGFNAGSALAANGIATIAFVNTNTATGAAVLGWMFSEWVGKGKPTAVGAATGAVAGLVAITPAAGFVEPWAAILIGVVAGFLCYKACNWKVKIGYDDALDVVGVHGVGGTWGAIATGLFATAAVGGTDGLFLGNPGQVVTQALAVGATYAFCGFGTFLILGIVNSVVGLRVDEEDEETGLDLTLHAESAYSSSSSGAPLGERPSRRERIAPPPAPARSPVASAPSLAASTPSPATSAPSLAASTPSPAASAPSRRPPVTAKTQREAPVAASSPAPIAAAPTVGSNSGSAVGEDKPFYVIINGVDTRALTRWWRDLCSQGQTKAPQSFREIYPHVRSFEGNTLYFRGGDPAATRERLADLLDIYGATASEVRVEGVH